MFENKELQNFLETSSTIRNKSVITAEWNMNVPTNIKHIGNYRYRPTQAGSTYSSLPTSFDVNDTGSFYTGATDADVLVDGIFDNNDLPTTLLTKKEKLQTLYSLEDCFAQFRPRSGINKAAFFENRKFHHPNLVMADRPRYYMPDKNDKFKYWTSYRTEGRYKYTYNDASISYGFSKTFIDKDQKEKNGVAENLSEYGIASKVRESQYSIEDACPFVVYKEKIPTNRVVVKMQTHTGTENLGPFTSAAGIVADSFYGELNQKTPSKWKIQFLKDGNWENIISFDPSIKRKDGTSVIKSDGYVEIAYGLVVPDEWRNTFVLQETYTSIALLPEKSIFGYAYLIKQNDNDLGTFHIWNGTEYIAFTPKYGWYIQDETIDRITNFVTDVTSPDVFIKTIDKKLQFREFEYISGIRIVVDTMNAKDSTFDLIEISPRLVLDISDKTLDYSINKSASDLGLSGLPVGQLIASNGSINIFDHDQAFNPNNKNSIISKYISRHIQFKFYEVIVDVDGWDYFVPIKTLYSDAFPKQDLMTKHVSIGLRDLYWYLESITAPEILMTEVSVSSAVSLLLDYIGFSNYTFKRVANEKEIIIPYFFVSPESSVAQVLEDLAVSTQTAMFFDEYNNFVMMSKNYIMPSAAERPTSFSLTGTKDFVQYNEIKNKTNKPKLANVISVSTQENSAYNDGAINYSTRYIQRSIGSLRQASLVDNERYYTYKPALLWEVSGTQNTKSINNEVATQSAYVLSAIPLNSDLTIDVPVVKNNILINNTFSLGEAVYWITRYNGYFYSQGEIIKYDAVQYNVSGFGNVWITSTEDYQNYFAKLPFNGKIYPTGLIRIYSEPKYFEKDGVVKLQNGEVQKHGRGQFGTAIVAHSAGIADHWKSDNNIKGCYMSSEYLFNKDLTLPSTTVASSGKLTNSGVSSDTLAKTSSRSGIIKNFMSTSFIKEISTATTVESGTIQSSALSLTGPNFTTKENPRDFISYVHKSLEENKYKHFGTRMRIVGKIENSSDRGQTSNGSATYYVVNGSTPDKNINISGGSGGLAFMLNSTTNVGYYFEIAALGIGNLSKDERESVSNVFFYKIKSNNGKAIPVKLWEGLGEITVDDGKFTGQARVVAEENPTVYDLAIEYQDIGKTRRFYLYLNGSLIKTVDDLDPLPVYSGIALFSRGSSRVMFENVYALCNNYSQNTTFSLGTPVNSVFGDSDIDANESFRKYALSGLIQNTYLSGIGTSEAPKYSIFFEEFGSIMREAATFNFKYDKAFPALTAKISPTFNKIKGYVVSGFRAGSYGAEFMIFNATDTAISLDETTGNYLRVQGVTFTQQSENRLTVDDYFNKNSLTSNPEFVADKLISNPYKFKQDYQDIKLSRMTYGKKDFSLNAPYIQSYDEANSLMKWLVEKITKPRKSIGVRIFAIPTLQLGDIVTLDYEENGISMASSPLSRFVIYNIDYSKSSDGPEMTVFLSEVV
jgi:hypothetical protein